MVEISGEYGDAIASDVISPMHHRLNELFDERLRNNYGRQVSMLCVVLRVSGIVWDARLDGPQPVRPFRRKGKYLELDLGVPRAAWEERPLKVVRRRLLRGLRAAFQLLKQKLAKVDPAADAAAWEADFEACLTQFEQEQGSREQPRKHTSANGRALYRSRRGRGYTRTNLK